MSKKRSSFSDKKTRLLQEDEKTLLNHLAQTLDHHYKPHFLKKEITPPLKQKKAKPIIQLPKQQKSFSFTHYSNKRQPLQKPKEPSLGEQKFNKKTYRKIARGAHHLEARLDLHGLNQNQAETALRRFILRCYQEQKRLILVITGKGTPKNTLYQDVGILKRMLPIWLSHPDLRSKISAFEKAHSKHGGGGAFYIRLKAFK